MTLALYELYEGLERLHNRDVSIMDLFNLQDTLYDELATIERGLQSLRMCNHKYHVQLPSMENRSVMTLTLYELCEGLERMHNEGVSVTDLFNLQSALLNEIAIVNHGLQSLRIGYHKHPSKKESGD